MTHRYDAATSAAGRFLPISSLGEVLPPQAKAAGQPERAEQLVVAAEQLARRRTRPYWQAEVLAEVAQALVAAGQPDRAEQLARSLGDPDEQAWALTEVAKALAEHGSVAARTCSCGATATLLASSSWFEAMPVLAALAPAAVTAAGTAMLEVVVSSGRPQTGP